ncbi:MAG: isochorismatase family protein [Kordiimonadaceae bacterium]|nr:isochorismatase family protein [Kordiimonadaceae bacterium]MBO6567293.1 isochorismatase family protein [Kordiimonadaceae bacterium]MBO6963493.1 isochorismatase family protein [Kordiimonadaceae bacterium]
MPADDLSLEEDYAAAGFGGALGFGKVPALLVIDMCMAYLDPAAPLYAGIDQEARQIERLLKAFRDAKRPVIHTRVEYVPGGADGGLFYKKISALKCFDKGNPFADPPKELQPIDGEVIVTKQYASAYFGTSLASTLSALGCDTVVVTGVSTSGCVRASALDTIQNGFIPLVVEDACGDRDEVVHKANMFDLQAKYADLVSTEQVIERLMAGWA